MGLINQDNRTKQDLTHTRTPEDVMRRLAKNVQITTDEVKGLTVEVSKKVGNDEIISRINQSAEAVEIDASKIKLEGYTTINGGFSVDEEGNAYIKTITGTINPAIELSSEDSVYRGMATRQFPGIMELNNNYTSGGGETAEPVIRLNWAYTGDITTLGAAGCYSPLFQQVSQESKKKNFEKFEDALKIIKDIDIYKYNLKSETDNTKKHLGFVIGDNYKYRKEVTSNDNTGVDLYSFISLCCKAIQEQQKEIEELKKVIK